MTALPLDVPSSSATLPVTHPVVILEHATAALREAASRFDDTDAAVIATALADRESAIKSLGAALGPRPPRLIVERLERVLADDRSIAAALQAHLDEVRRELGELGRARTAAAAYAAVSSRRTR